MRRPASSLFFSLKWKMENERWRANFKNRVLEDFDAESIPARKVKIGTHPRHPCDPSYPWASSPRIRRITRMTRMCLSFDPEFRKKAGGNVFFAIASGKWKLLLSLL